MISDKTAYRRYLDGEEKAADLLVERYGDALTLYINGYIKDIHEAEDLMIEAFAYLIAKRPAIRDGGFRTYLYQSARHMALRLLHKKRARNCFSLDALTEEPEARELVEEARRVAHNYASSGTSRFSSRWRTLNPIVYTLIGAGTIGLAWLIVALA